MSKPFQTFARARSCVLAVINEAACGTEQSSGKSLLSCSCLWRKLARASEETALLSSLFVALFPRPSARQKSPQPSQATSFDEFWGVLLGCCTAQPSTRPRRAPRPGQAAGQGGEFDGQCWGRKERVKPGAHPHRLAAAWLGGREGGGRGARRCQMPCACVISATFFLSRSRRGTASFPLLLTCPL